MGLFESGKVIRIFGRTVEIGRGARGGATSGMAIVRGSFAGTRRDRGHVFRERGGTRVEELSLVFIINTTLVIPYL